MDKFKWLDHLPAGLRLRRLLATIWAELTFPQSCWPGHFYSPIPDRKEIEADGARIFRTDQSRLPEIELQEPTQLALLARLAAQARPLKLPVKAVPGSRYHSENSYFFLADALVFAALLLEFKPRHYMEIGSGFTSALALDMNDRHLGGGIKFTFIEPWPARLHSLLKEADRQSVTIHESRIQKMPDAVFAGLARNDFLFVDGSHVSKVGSDLNDVLFRILPLLQPGVIIHFHDIFWPFEYSREQVFQGISWNEAYLLRAFLANNSKYEVLFFPSWLEAAHAQEWQGAFPGVKGIRSSSLWIRKL